MSSRSGRVASWRLSFTTSTIFDSTDGDNATGDCDSPVVKRGNKIIFSVTLDNSYLILNL